MEKGKIFGMVVALVALLWAGVTSVAAKKLGEDYSVQGIQLGWVLIIAVVAVYAVAFLMKAGKKTVAKLTPIMAILVIAGLALSFVDAPNAVVPTGAITPNVTWKVTATTATANTTIDQNTKIITCIASVNSTSGKMVPKGKAGTFVNPKITFACRPDPESGSIVDLTQGASMQVRGSDPGKVIYSGGTDYALINKDSSGVKTYINWTYAGNTETVDRIITVQFGDTGNVNLSIYYNAAGVSKSLAGKTYSIPLTVAGESWVLSLYIDTVYT